MDATTLAAALAERLAQVVPAGIDVHAMGPAVSAQDRDGLGAVFHVGAILDQDGDPERHLISACLGVLDGLQDIVAEELREPWPTRSMPGPAVVIDGRVLRPSYGAPDRPALALNPIQLDEPAP